MLLNSSQDWHVHAPPPQLYLGVYGIGGAASPLPAVWTFNTAPILLKHLPPSFCQSTGLRFLKLSIAVSPLHLCEPTWLHGEWVREREMEGGGGNQNNPTAL